MTLWPFRKRRKKTSKAEGKKPAALVDDFQDEGYLNVPGARFPSRRSSHRRDPLSHSQREISFAASSGVLVPDFPSSPRHPVFSDDDEFLPQKQQHHSGGFASYFSEHDDDGDDIASELSSIHRPEKSSSLIRKLSKRKMNTSTFSLGRQNSKRSRHSPYLQRQQDSRPFSATSAVPRASLHSVNSQSSASRAYKVKGFGMFAPRPILVYEDGTSSMLNRSRDFGGPGLVPSRSNSRRTNSRATADRDWRYKGPLMSEEHLMNREGRVDDLADEMDVHSLREAMERDRRRRERRKKEEEERLQRKIERKALYQQRYQQKPEEGNEPSGVEHEARDNQHDQEMPDYQPEESSPASQNVQERQRLSTGGSQTPLSWFNDNPSVDNVSKQYTDFTPRADVVTPVSMDSGDYLSGDHRYEGTNIQPDSPQNIAVGANPSPVIQPPQDTGRAKTSTWTSFIKKATAARIKKEHDTRENESTSIQAGESALISDSESEDNDTQNNPPPDYLEVQDLRRREGQTPGRHVATEITVAMNALETGQFKEYEDEIRDTVPPTPPMAPYLHNNGSQNSSRSSLERYRTPKDSAKVTTKELPNGLPNGRSSSQQSYHHSRPPSAQRYSPMGKYSSGAASPGLSRPRSAMSASLASIDSEGSWLSGKINPRQSIPQISPLRTSASSLRRQYQEMGDNDDTSTQAGDDYFSGVDPSDGGARLDLDDSDVESVGSEAERSMWRGGAEKKVAVVEEDDQPTFLRTQSSIRMLNEEESPQIGTHEHCEEIEQPSSTSMTPDVFATPLEHPGHTMTSDDLPTPKAERPGPIRTETVYETPLEQPGVGYIESKDLPTPKPKRPETRRMETVYQTPLEETATGHIGIRDL